MLSISGYKTQVMPDTRGPFLKLSRMSLYYLAVANGNTQVRDDMPKDTIVKILEIEPQKYLKSHPDGTYSYKNVEVFSDPQNGGIKIGRVDEAAPEPEPAPAKKKGV